MIGDQQKLTEAVDQAIKDEGDGLKGMHGYDELKRMQESIKHLETQIQQSIAESIVIVNS
jgi:hypothetical protein